MAHRFKNLDRNTPMLLPPDPREWVGEDTSAKWPRAPREGSAKEARKKITGMNPGEGFAANVATALLVNTASFHSLPVSTTHVSVGSLLGIGIVTRKAKWRSVGSIALSWLITLPCGAALEA